jgi:hypothetical protein
VNKHTNETLGFNGFHNYMGPYYGLMSQNDGYGGFDYSSDVLFMKRSTWTAPNGAGYKQFWCDTGYQNACPGKGEAWVYTSGIMESANPKETFSLGSMIAAASWSSDQPWLFSSYVYKDGALHLKTSDTVYIGQTAEKINFAKLGGGKAFQNIAAFSIQFVNYGQQGNDCNGSSTYYGRQLAFDDIKIRWNGKIPGADAAGHHHMLVPPFLGHHQHPTAMPVGWGEHLPSHPHNETIARVFHQNTNGPYHSQLLALDHDTTLTAQFVLPQPEHFGTWASNCCVAGSHCLECPHRTWLPE